MSNIVPFENAKLPAHIAKYAAVNNIDDLTSGVGAGYPVISIKGKNFHLVRGDERTLITRPDDPDTPAASLDVVILRANPHLSKVYYSTGYVEGSDAKPDCYSNDGIAPAADAENPQAKKCATCPHNQWGSRITENDKKGKACSDSRRIAVATTDAMNDPMLVRVPAASLKALAQYGDTLKKRGVPYSVVLTKVGFDHSVAHPSLTFKPVGFLSEEQAEEAAAMAGDDVVTKIIGASGVLPGEMPSDTPEKAPALAKALDETKATTKVKVEDEPAAPAKAAKKEKPTEVKTTSGDMDEIERELANLDFDD